MILSVTEIDALVLSLKVAVLSTLLNLPFAVFWGFILARRNFLGKNFVDAFLSLPLVMPPVVTGYLLLLLFGRRGFIGGGLFELFGLRLSFSLAGAVLASMVVSFPLTMRAVRIAFEMSNKKLERAASTLRASPFQVFRLITLPLALPGLINGIVLGFARSLGEFGATITFAGNIAGKTRTIPLAVYSEMQIPGHEAQTLKLTLVSIIVALLAMIFSEILNNYNKKRFVGR